MFGIRSRERANCLAMMTGALDARSRNDGLAGRRVTSWSMHKMCDRLPLPPPFAVILMALSSVSLHQKKNKP